MNALIEWLISLFSGSQSPGPDSDSEHTDTTFPPLAGDGEQPPAVERPGTPDPSGGVDILQESNRIGLVIVDHEARRDKKGNLEVYKLPANDGGGEYEIAGINDEFHPEALAALRAMKPEERESFAAEYIETYVRTGTGLSEPTGLRDGTLLFVLDSAFNRGPGGAAWIVQDALIRAGHDLKHDRTWGPMTRAALRTEDQKQDGLVKQLRMSREKYEIDVVIPRHPKGSRDKFWNGLVNRWNKIAEIAHEWNAKEPKLDSEIPTPPQADIKPRPDTIRLPRENTSALNRFYGTANESGSYNEWFSFPVADVVLYNRGGAGLSDRDGDGRDEHRCHGMIVDDLEAALQEIYDTIGHEDFYHEGWHVYGGCFNYRYKTSGGSLSTHSWAIAVDINPDGNGWKHYGTTFSDEAIDIMEKHGFLSAGRAWGHDYMHFQKAIPSVTKGYYYDRNGLPAHIQAA